MARRRRRRARGRGRLLLLGLVVVGALVGVGFMVHRAMPAWYARAWYPLEYQGDINREARHNGLDPALVAAVVWRESDFDAASQSRRGAVGLMQVLPSTARFIASSPNPPTGSASDLADPAVNLAFGSWYLRWLIDRHGGSVPEALAAYNGGPANVTEWKRRAAAAGRTLRVPEDIPFAETRAYVTDVLQAWGIYRRAYGDRLASPG